MAGNGSSILGNWTLLDFDFTSDCNRTARFYYANRLDKDYSFSTDIEFFPYAEFIDFVRHAAPDPFANLSRGVIVDWIDGLNFYIQDSRNQPWMFSKNLSDCTPEFCESLQWEGNPDLAGIGVLISYVIEVCLATVFIVVLGSRYLLHWQQPMHRVFNVNKPIWAAFQTSLGLFWDTAFLFHLAVTMAGLVSVGESDSVYISDFAHLSSAVTWSVIALTWPLYRPTCHHRKARGLGLVVASVLCASLMWWERGYSRSRDGGIFEYLCYQQLDGNTDLRISSATMSKIVQYLTGSLTGLCLAVYLGHYAAKMYYRCRLGVQSRSEGSGHKLYQTAPTTPRVSKGRSGIPRWVVGLSVLSWMVVVFALMYLTLATFVLKRTLTALAAGPSLEENRWGFGQVMALTVWFPTGVDFILVIRGNLKALKYRLPRGVDVDILDQRKGVCDREKAMVSVEYVKDKEFQQSDAPL